MRLERTPEPRQPGRHSALRETGTGLRLFRPLARGAGARPCGTISRRLARTGSRTPAMPTGVSSGCGCARPWPGLGSQGVTPERLAALAEASARTNALLERLRRPLAFHAGSRRRRPASAMFPRSPSSACREPLQQRILARIVRHYGGGQSTARARGIAPAGPLGGRGAGALHAGRRAAGAAKAGFLGCAGGGPDLSRAADHSGERYCRVGRALPRHGRARSLGLAPPAGPPCRWADDVPAVARRAYPLVEQPAGAAEGPQIAFLRLLLPERHIYAVGVLGKGLAPTYVNAHCRDRTAALGASRSSGAIRGIT